MQWLNCPATGGIPNSLFPYMALCQKNFTYFRAVIYQWEIVNHLIHKQANHTMHTISTRVQCIKRTRKPEYNIKKVQKISNKSTHIVKKNFQVR